MGYGFTETSKMKFPDEGYKVYAGEAGNPAIKIMPFFTECMWVLLLPINRHKNLYV